MITKNEVLLKIDALKNYCIANGEPGGDYTGFINVLTAPVAAYFDSAPAGLLDRMNYLIPQVYSDLMNRDATYENQYGEPMPTDYPEGYADLSSLFDGDGAFTEIMGMDPAVFLDGFPVESITDETSGATSTVVTANPIIATWAAAIGSAHAAELDKIQEIISFCERSAYNQGLISLFENRGKMTRTKTNQDLARELYLTMKYKDVIKAFDLDVYIPSYV